MNKNILNTLVSIFAGGVWGYVVYLLSVFIASKVSIGSYVYYPVLFGGISFILVLMFKSEFPSIKALIIGIVAGIVYSLTSRTFPFFSTVAVGGIIGWGLWVEQEKFSDFLNRIISTIKGLIFFPVFVYLGGLLVNPVTGIIYSPSFVWFFWGGLISLSIFFIMMPIFQLKRSEVENTVNSEVDEFRQEVQNIVRDLNQMNIRYK